MANIYSNENIPLPVAEELRRFGHDVLTTRDAGNDQQSIPDQAVLDYACSQSRILLTLNRRHFVRLHTEIPQHAGIIVCSYDPDYSGQAQRIHNTVVAEFPITGKLIRINRP